MKTLRHWIPFCSFATRCAISAAFAYWLSASLGQGHTVWAVMSALIVSQEKFDATRRHVLGRIAGTCIGALVALIVHLLLKNAHPDQLAEIVVAVSICAIIAWGRPTLRVCLWTCPLVLLTTSAQESPELTAWSRTIEVFIGAIAGGLLHYIEILIFKRLNLNDSSHTADKPATPGSATD